jgi:hypothetical protein
MGAGHIGKLERLAGAQTPLDNVLPSWKGCQSLQCHDKDVFDISVVYTLNLRFSYTISVLQDIPIHRSIILHPKSAVPFCFTSRRCLLHGQLLLRHCSMLSV